MTFTPPVTVTDALKLLQTSDPVLVAGTSFESEAIEVITDQMFSHAATFYWDGDIPMVAEENERGGSVLNAGFEVVPFLTWITQQT